MKKKVEKIIAVLILFLIVFAYINNAFYIKYSDGIYSLNVFYELDKNTVDVLFLGSSHAFENYNTSVLWDEHGIASYVLGGSEQPMWNTYYYLKEALKTQSPELIVLEGYGVVYSDEYMSDYSMYKNCLGIKSLSNRIGNINASAGYRDRLTLLFPLFSFHDRYRELSYEDFMKDKGDVFYESWKGFANNFDKEQFSSSNYKNVGEVSDLSKKTEKYYRKIIELSKDNNIPLIIIVNPYPLVKESEIKKINKAKIIAQEYEVDFYDYSLSEKLFGIDYSEDAADQFHLNYKGNVKLTRAIGDMLYSKYNITNRKGDEKYISWDENSSILNRTVANYENTVNSFEDLNTNNYINDYSVFFFVNDEYKSEEHLENYLKTQDISIDNKKINHVWYKNYSSGEIKEYEYCMNDEFIRKIIDKDLIKADYSKDKDYFTKTDEGVNVVVFDNYLDKVVDNYGIIYKDGFIIIR